MSSAGWQQGTTLGGIPVITCDSGCTTYGQRDADMTRAIDCWNACHGLALPPDIAPGALAALVTAARALLIQEDWEGEDVPPGSPVGLMITALAPFTRDPAAISPPERKPYGYAVKTAKGYLATQGRQAWFEDEPVGWAVFGTEDHARAMLEANHSMIGTAPHEGGEVVPVYRPADDIRRDILNPL